MPTNNTAHSTTRDYVDLFETVKTVAIVGASTELMSPGWRTAFGLHGNGVKVYFVAPGGSDRFGITSTATLSEVPCDIDLLDYWGESSDLNTTVLEAINKRVRIIWFEPNAVALPNDLEVSLSKTDVHVIRNKSLHGEYLLAYSCA